jgi:predicted transcriptional regulator
MGMEEKSMNVSLTELEKRILLILLDFQQIDLDELCAILNEPKVKVLVALERLRKMGYISEEMIGVNKCDGRD